MIGAEDRRRWLREAQAIGRVRHPNVVQLHDAGEQDGCLYLVLDLITGGSLADRVTGPLPARVAVGLMAAVARAVDQIHKAGMLHLDIKPSNILLDGPPDGPWDQVTPMLADFGIARAGDDPGATATGPIGVRGHPLVHGSGTDCRRPRRDRCAIRCVRPRGHPVQPLDRTSSVPGRVGDRDPRPGAHPRARPAEDARSPACRATWKRSR